MTPPLSTRKRTARARGLWMDADTPAERKVVVPKRVVAAALEHPLLRGLIPTSAGFVQAKPRHREQPPLADAALFLYCAKGHGWCEVDGRRHEIRQGELVVAPANISREYGTLEPHAWTVFWAQAMGAHVDLFLGELGVNAQNPAL